MSTTLIALVLADKVGKQYNKLETSVVHLVKSQTVTD